MRLTVDCPWYWRLAYGFIAPMVTLILAIAFIVARDFYREPDLQWSNGGEVQIVGYALIVGVETVLATYIFFIVPLVMLWPPRSQLTYWYLMAFAAILWPILLLALVSRPTDLSMLFEGLRGSRGEYYFTSVFALFATGCYLMLLKRHLRRKRLAVSDAHQEL